MTLRDFGELIREITANVNQYVGARAVMNLNAVIITINMDADEFRNLPSMDGQLEVKRV